MKSCVVTVVTLHLSRSSALKSSSTKDRTLLSTFAERSCIRNFTQKEIVLQKDHLPLLPQCFWGTLGITPVNEWSPPIPALHSTCAPSAKKPPETPSGNFSSFQFPGLSTPDFHQDAIGGFETCRPPQTSEVVFSY